MAFSNPFDDPQGAFYILRNAQGNSVCGRNNAPYRQAGTLCVSRSHRRPASSGWKPLAYSDTGEFHPVAGAQ